MITRSAMSWTKEVRAVSEAPSCKSPIIGAIGHAPHIGGLGREMLSRDHIQEPSIQGKIPCLEMLTPYCPYPVFLPGKPKWPLY